MENKEIAFGIISEVSLFAFLYYMQLLLRIEENLWLSTAILWVLLNLSIIFCPVVRKCYKS